MSRFKIVRMAQGDNSTLSHFYIHGYFWCYLLEDSIRNIKVHGATCIPEGVYPLKLNMSAGMNVNYKKRYPGIHKGMLEIVDIPNFNLVFIHIGNTHLDTKGCPLTGRSWNYENGEYRVVQSALAYESLYKKLIAVLNLGPAKIEVVNHLGYHHGF